MSVFWRRLGAYITDFLLVLPLAQFFGRYGPQFFADYAPGRTKGFFADLFMQISPVAVGWVVMSTILFSILMMRPDRRGQTWGKQLFGVCVVAKGNKVNFFQAVVREGILKTGLVLFFAWFLLFHIEGVDNADQWALFLLFLSCLLATATRLTGNRAGHDLLTGTKVIRCTGTETELEDTMSKTKAAETMPIEAISADGDSINEQSVETLPVEGVKEDNKQAAEKETIVVDGEKDYSEKKTED